MLFRQRGVKRLAHGDTFPRREQLARHHGVAGQLRSGPQHFKERNARLVEQPAMRGESRGGEMPNDIAEHRQMQQRSVPRITDPR